MYLQVRTMSTLQHFNIQSHEPVNPFQIRQSENFGESTSDRLEEWNFLDAVATGLAGADIESAEYCWPLGSP